MNRRGHADLLHRALLIGLIGMSLFPQPEAERWLDRGAAPLRILARATVPLTRLLGREVAAFDPAQGRAEEQESRRFVARLFESALPPGELAGRCRAVPAVVLARSRGERDRVIVRPWTLAGIELGQPAVHREAYVGRVVAIDAELGAATVELLTARSFRVGARLLPPASLRALAAEDPGVALTVGGVALGRRSSEGQLPYLAAHDPARARGILAELPLEGPLEVHEWLPELDPYSGLAEGFALGRLLPEKNQQDRRVEPLIDFLHGLFHLAILTEARPGLELPSAPAHPLEDAEWVAARIWATGEPSRWRRSLQLEVGARDGLVEGCAVVAGARLIGRLGAVLPASCEVRLLDDPGLSLPVAAGFPDDPARAPQVLGRMTTLGRDPLTGRPLLHWQSSLAFELPGAPAGTPVRLTLFTGTGEVGLPAGLLLGESYVRTGQTEGSGQRLALTDASADPGPDRPLWVRRPGAAETRLLRGLP